jgi:hypothetical protein
MWNHGDVNRTGTVPISELSSPNNTKHSSSRTGAIVGGVFGALAGIAIIAVIVIWIKKRQRNKSYELHSLNEH